MQTTTLSFENLHNHGELFANFFRARKQSFIVQKNWDLPEALDMEYDQYDTPASRWIAIHEFGEVYAGIRLTPTTMKCGMYSYMIRDAQRGLLGTIPEDLLYEEAPVDEQTWECTRVFVSHTTPQRIRRRVHALMVAAMLKGSREQGASKLITLTASNWPRWFGRCGLDAKAVGREMFIGDGDYQCVMIDLTSNLH
ncbi:acyl-homoserine-lactone synthase [Halocynthiibacter namhaensis]|uniref:acyl-homoserine-lactone synthase n=1 Tax=Halocynthiibacter namhaensis TaxID=1290553 RepID=UPI000578F962|nr:acyl-homoserine-lactone synthase [Halocynthiibacter namhaensis]